MAHELAQLRELVGQLRAEVSRLAGAGTVAPARRVPTEARALARLERHATDLALLGEVVGTWRSAPDLARLTGESPDRVRRVLGAWTVPCEEHPSALVETRTVGGTKHYRATSSGEHVLAGAVRFDVGELDDVQDSAARAGQAHEEEAA